MTSPAAPPARPSPIAAWWMGIRPKTLSAATAPVLVGTALAARDGAFAPLPALAALAGGLLIQIGTNLANDVLDYRRGADRAERLGPIRVTQAGLLSARQVTLGATACFAAAALAGAYLTCVAGPPILVVGVLAIASGVAYTAGPYPLAYVGLGDAFVLAFFGLAAVGGTYFVQARALASQALWLGLAVGALSVAILNVNNLRDIVGDRQAGKRTLAVRIGPAATRGYLLVVVAAAFLVPVALVAARALPPACLLVLAGVPSALRLSGAVASGVEGRALAPWLGATARLQMLHAALLAAGLLLDRLAELARSGP